MTMKRSTTILTLCLLMSALLCAVPTMSAASETARLEKRLDQQQRRIDRLERAVESLQSRLLDEQYAPDGASGRPGASEKPAKDPLTGVWECSNNVFTYEISFFANGRLIQEEPFFSKTAQDGWTRTSDDEFVTRQGHSFRTEFRNDDELTVTNQSNRAVWECSRK